MAKKRTRYVSRKQRIAEHNKKASRFRKGFASAALSVVLVFGFMPDSDIKKDIDNSQNSNSTISHSYDEVPMISYFNDISKGSLISSSSYSAHGKLLSKASNSKKSVYINGIKMPDNSGGYGINPNR